MWWSQDPWGPFLQWVGPGEQHLSHGAHSPAAWPVPLSGHGSPLLCHARVRDSAFGGRGKALFLGWAARGWVSWRQGKSLGALEQSVCPAPLAQPPECSGCPAPCSHRFASQPPGRPFWASLLPAKAPTLGIPTGPFVFPAWPRGAEQLCTGKLCHEGASLADKESSVPNISTRRESGTTH